MPNLLFILAWATLLIPNLALCWLLFKSKGLNNKPEPLIIEKEARPPGRLIRTAKGVYLHQERFDPVVNSDEDQWLDEMNKKGRT